MFLEYVVVLGQIRVFAIGNTVLAQIASLKVRRGDLQRSMRRGTARRTRHFPQGRRVSLQRGWTGRSLPIAEVKHTGLRSTIDIHAQGTIILPRNVKVFGLTK